MMKRIGMAMACFALLATPAFASANDASDTVQGFIFLAILGAAYFLPAIIAGKRGINASIALFFVNLFVGWTVIGWIVCLIWAASGATKAQDAFYKNAAAQPATDAAYHAAYARERARLDYEAAHKA